MTSAISWSSTPDIKGDDYCVFGLATCFVREDGETHQIQVIEPIPSAALEAILKGIPTSYELACAKTVGEFLADDTLKIPGDFPQGSQLGDDFRARVVSACRTYKSRPEAQKHIPLGSTYQDLNYSLERKRVLNASRAVTKDDNVKQHSHTHKVL